MSHHPSTNDRRRAPENGRKPKGIADGPPATPEGRRNYEQGELEKSADFHDRREREAHKPYATESELYDEAVEDDGTVVDPKTARRKAKSG